ncbi:MAG: RNA polymerase sigma factor [Lachnospiraceae bacterium]|nr:RNA polymerase sigma factor [Lachnospiraceae bacterium]
MRKHKGGFILRDNEIVALYWERDEAALTETERKYGRYLKKIAFNVLADFEDSEECVNDTYFKAWNSMPTQKPEFLATYLGAITRRSAIDRYRRRNSQKRVGSQYAVALEELEDCISNGNVTEQEVELHILGEVIGSYLKTVPEEARDAFIGRYYFHDSLEEIAGYCRMSVTRVKSLLYRLRKGLKKYLEEEGYFYG